MTPLAGIIDSYDIHVPWANFAINLYGAGCAEVREPDRRIVVVLQELLDDLYEFCRKSLI